MKLLRRHFLSIACTTLAGLATSRITRADTYPARPVRVIVPYAPCGATDIVARPILQEVSRRVCQQFCLANIPCPGGNIRTGQAAGAVHDCYTIPFAYRPHV